MTTPQVTILIPPYKTLELTKLYLRLTKKLTENLARVIVINGNSKNAS
jgi:hypothetical protein